MSKRSRKRDKTVIWLADYSGRFKNVVVEIVIPTHRWTIAVWVLSIRNQSPLTPPYALAELKAEN